MLTGFDISLNVSGVETLFQRKIIVQPSGFPRFARVKHWHERYFNAAGQGLSYIAAMRQISGNPRLYTGAGGDPSVFKLNSTSTDRAVHLTPDIEWWMFNLLRQSSKGMLLTSQVKTAYKNMLQGQKAFTNFAGWSDGYQSVVLNMNIGAEPQRLMLAMANGATIRVLGDKIKRGGQWCYPFEVMNAQDKNTLNRTLKDSWWLMMPATNSTVEPAPEGTVNNFPYFGNYDAIIPMLANNTTVGYIQAEWVEFLGNITQPVYPYYRSYISESEWKKNRGLV
jgi:hypothetical protein